MSGRRDYYRDPNAPKANSLKPGGSALVVDEQGRILMQRRTDSGNWALPGGVMDLGENLQQCVIREVKKETGLDIEITGLLGIYTDPQHVIAYSDGEVRQEFNLTDHSRVIGGTITVSDESTEVRFVQPGELANLPVHDTVKGLFERPDPAKEVDEDVDRDRRALGGGMPADKEWAVPRGRSGKDGSHPCRSARGP